jgi:hypothetical protein
MFFNGLVVARCMGCCLGCSHPAMAVDILALHLFNGRVQVMSRIVCISCW